jgi:cytochrome P450
MKESMRLHPVALYVNIKKVMPKAGVTFSGNIHVPHGSFVALPVYAIHRDNEIYPNADCFEGFRFLESKNPSHERMPSKTVGTFVTQTAPDYLVFNDGRYSWSVSLAFELLFYLV